MLSFRSKKLGWSKHLVSVQLADGRDVTAEWAKQLDFFKLWNSQCINRPACYRCPYANEKRAGDFTGGDFVGIEKLAYQAPVEEGVSVFTVNTEKAHKLLPRLPLTLMPVTQQQCLQQGMEYAAAAPKGRDAFWALYREKRQTDTGKEIDLSCDCACLQETGHLSARREDLPQKVRRKGAT